MKNGQFSVNRELTEEVTGYSNEDDRKIIENNTKLKSSGKRKVCAH